MSNLYSVLWAPTTLSLTGEVIVILSGGEV